MKLIWRLSARRESSSSSRWDLHNVDIEGPVGREEDVPLPTLDSWLPLCCHAESFALLFQRLRLGLLPCVRRTLPFLSFLDLALMFGYLPNKFPLFGGRYLFLFLFSGHRLDTFIPFKQISSSRIGNWSVSSAACHTPILGFRFPLRPCPLSRFVPTPRHLQVQL